MRKMGLLAMLIMILLVFPSHGQAAASGTHIILDGEELTLPTGTQVLVVNQSVMIPIRVVMEQLGFDVNWKNATRTATISQKDTVIKLVIDQQTAIVNDQKVKLVASPFISAKTTFVPLRFVSEQMGIKVSWSNASKTATLTRPVVESETGSEVDDSIDGTTPGTTTPGGSPIEGTTNTGDLALIQSMTFSDNRLIISVDGKTTANAFRIAGPDRIVVDMPNTAFSASFIAGYMEGRQNGQFTVTDYPDVSGVRYSLFSNSPSTIRVVIDVKSAKNFNFVNGNDGLIIVDFNEKSPGDTTLPGTNKRQLVVIDAGHGGNAPGAVSIRNRLEKEFNLSVVLKVETLLRNQKDFDFVLTRNDDSNPSLAERAKLANELNANLFVSIHGNSSTSSTPNGVETYYTRDESIRLANIMHKYLVKSTGLVDRSVRSKSLYVTRETKMPAVLLECGYLSNETDEALLFTEEAQQRIAEGIVAGIREYLGIK